MQILVRPQSSGGWHRCLNALHDEGIIPGLTDQGLRVLTVFLRINDAVTGTLDASTGLVQVTIARLMELTGRGRTFVYEGRAELLRHQRALLAHHGRDKYAVMPGWTWAGRPQGADRVVRTARTNRPQGADGVYEERARATHPREHEDRLDQEGRGGTAVRGVGGWPTLTEAGRCAVERGNVSGVLQDLRVWPYMADALAECPKITVQHVLQVAAEVAIDPKPQNKPICLGRRLARTFGVKIPKAPTPRRGVTPAGLEGIEALRARRGVW